MTLNETRAGPHAFTDSFLSKVASPSSYDVLFEHLPDVYFFVKDLDGRFMRANNAFLGLARATSEEDVIGARDADFFPASLAESYTRDDRQVLRSSEPMVDKAELVRNAYGSVDWFCTTKLPLFDKSSRAIGICGITRDVKKMSINNAEFLAWAPVLETFLNDYANPMQLKELAQKMDLSVSQLHRRFRRRFHTTPRAYLTNVRLNAACYLLVATDLSISEIACKTGFHDQSHLTNQFTRRRGLPPSKYRARYGRLLPPA